MANDLRISLTSFSEEDSILTVYGDTGRVVLGSRADLSQLATLETPYLQVVYALARKELTRRGASLPTE